MAITLYSEPNLRGDRLQVIDDITDLGASVLNKSASSMHLSSVDDRVLLFTKPNWRGDVMFRRGAANINHLGRPAQGGQRGFNDATRSVRITPFELQVHCHVVRNEAGALPGGLADLSAVDHRARTMVEAASAVWEQYLVRLTLNGISFVTSEALFDQSHEYLELLSSSLFTIRKNMANMILVNSIRGSNQGLGVPRCLSKRVVVEAGSTGLLLAHELGHYLGLFHKNKEPNNLMNHNIRNKVLSLSQVETVHAHLRGKPIRQDVRVE